MVAAGTRAAAATLLFCFSVIVVVLLVLLQAPRRPGLAAADLVVAARDRFLDGRGRGLLELATRRNMILLCHAILLLILRDAGVLGAPAARRRSRSPPGEDATAAAAADAVVSQTAALSPARIRPHASRTAAVVGQGQTARSAVVPVPARPHATRSAVVWRRRPRSRAAAAAAPTHEHVAARRLVECHPAAEAAAATWAAPVLTTRPSAQAEEAAAAVVTKQIVLVESPRNDDDDDDLLDRHDRASAIEPLDRPTAIIAVAGERDDCDDRRIVAVDDEKSSMNDTPQQTPGMEMEMEMELADDRTFEEFIKSQRRQMQQESLRQMRQESLQLLRSGSGSGYHYQPMIAACY